MIELQNVSFNFNRQVQVLDNASYTFHKGHFYSLSGSTEAARNVIFSLISGLTEPALGRVIYDGINIKHMSINELLRKKIGFHLQNNPFVHHLNVLRIIEMAIDISLPKKKQIKESIFKIFKELDFDNDILSKKITELNSIQRFMVNVSIFVLCEKETVFFNTLFDTTESHEDRILIVGQLRKLAQDMGKCVILSTDSKEIAKLSDKIVVLKNGKLI